MCIPWVYGGKEFSGGLQGYVREVYPATTMQDGYKDYTLAEPALSINPLAAEAKVVVFEAYHSVDEPHQEQVYAKLRKNFVATTEPLDEKQEANALLAYDTLELGKLFGQYEVIHTIADNQCTFVCKAEDRTAIEGLLK